MMEISYQFFDIYSVIWLFPVVFMFHDLEEIITVEHFMAKYKNKIQILLPTKLASIVEKRFSTKTAQFSIAVTWIFLLISLITFMTAHSLPYGGNFLFFTASITIFFLHVFTHIVQTIIFRGYTPGVVTAVFIVLPYSIYTYYRLLQSSLIDWHLIYVSIPIGILILPVLLIGHILGRQFIR